MDKTYSLLFAINISNEQFTNILVVLEVGFVVLFLVSFWIWKKIYSVQKHVKKQRLKNNGKRNNNLALQ